VLPLAGAMTYLWWQALEDSRAREVSLLQFRVEQVERNIRELWSQSEWVMSRMVKRPAFRALSTGACDDEMAVMREINSAFLAITLWDREGKLVCSSYPVRPDKPEPQPHRKSFDAGLATGGLYLSNVFPGQITGLNLVTFTYPVKDGSGATTGLLSIPVRAETFEKLLQDVVHGPGGTAGITDRDLVLVARVPVDERWRGKSIVDVVSASNEAPVPKGALVSTGVDGVKRIVARKTLPDIGWHVFVSAEEGVLFAGFRRQLVQGVSIFALVIAASLALAYLIARGISRPLRDMVGVADAVAQGDRAARAATTGDGEIARLAREMNRMLDSLEQSESSMRNSESRLRAIIETEPECVTVLGSDGYVREKNAAGLAVLEADSLEQLRQRPLIERVVPEYRDAFEALFRRALGGESGVLQYELETLKGRRRWLETHSAPLRDVGGNVTDMLGITLDITDRNRMENELRESEGRYRTLAEFSPDAILIHQDFRIVFANRAMAQLMRAASPAELVGRPSLFMLPPEHLEAARRRTERLYAGERQPRAEQAYLRLDGSSVEVEIASAPLTFNGRPAAQVTVRDIAVRKQAEKLLRASMARARDLAARLLKAEENERKRIAHDLHDQLGQELTALKIRVETIARTTESAQTRSQLLDVAVAAGDVLQRVREMSVDLRPPQLDSLGLAATLRAHARKLSALGKVAVHFDSRGLQGAVPAETEIMCFRVAQEALTNVMRHSGAAHAWVELALAEGALRLSVRDDGTGFDPARALERAGSGEGLGLLGMRERASLAGGTLDIRSQPAQGCTVTATFPLPAIGTGAA